MDKKNNNQKYDRVLITTIVMLITSVLFLSFGITFTLYKNFFRGTTNNIIEAGRLAFSYDEETSQFNGVKMNNAFPISDDDGKKLNGKNEYFDFSVSASTTLANIDYQIYAIKQDETTLSDEWVKVYLTLINSEQEGASPLVIADERVLTFKELTGDDNVKLIYNGTVPISNTNYHQDFRLRIWINDEISIEGREEELFNKTFSVKVKVTANQK